MNIIESEKEWILGIITGVSIGFVIGFVFGAYYVVMT